LEEQIACKVRDFGCSDICSSNERESVTIKFYKQWHYPSTGWGTGSLAEGFKRRNKLEGVENVV
jgi:hypothetical protein